jgi:hypothetical protein
MPNNKIICERIEITGLLSRPEIVKKVVNIFIQTEMVHPRPGTIFFYPVENLPEGQLLIRRPAGARKWNFDFKVEVTENLKLGRGTHDEMLLDFKNKKQENPTRFKDLLDALAIIYNSEENNVDILLQRYANIETSFHTGAKVSIFLKVIKWMFIMEDIVYWNYKGRTKLYKYLIEGIR